MSAVFNPPSFLEAILIVALLVALVFLWVMRIGLKSVERELAKDLERKLAKDKEL